MTSMNDTSLRSNPQLLIQSCPLSVYLSICLPYPTLPCPTLLPQHPRQHLPKHAPDAALRPRPPHHHRHTRRKDQPLPPHGGPPIDARQQRGQGPRHDEKGDLLPPAPLLEQDAPAADETAGQDAEPGVPRLRADGAGGEEAGAEQGAGAADGEVEGGDEGAEEGGGAGRVREGLEQVGQGERVGVGVAQVQEQVEGQVHLEREAGGAEEADEGAGGRWY